MANNTAMHAYGSGIEVYNYLTSFGKDLDGSFADAGGDANTLFTSLVGGVEIQQVIESTGDGISVGQSETTHLKSPNRWRQRVPGFKDAQTAQIQVNYTEASYAALAARVPQGALTAPAWGRYIWLFEYPDGAFDLQVGFISNLGKPRLADDRIMVDVTIAFSGPIYFFTTDD